MSTEKQKHTLGFKITEGKGFCITFENGYAVSVQFGGGNYCSNYNDPIGKAEWIASGEKGSDTVECAVWGPDEEMIEYKDWGNFVSNRSTPAEVLELLNWAAKQTMEEENDD